MIDEEIDGEVRRSIFKGKEAALHPTDDELIAYADETLSAEDRKKLRGHLGER